jgi:hypothetical protein
MKWLRLEVWDHFSRSIEVLEWGATLPLASQCKSQPLNQLSLELAQLSRDRLIILNLIDAKRGFDEYMIDCRNGGDY